MTSPALRAVGGAFELDGEPFRIISGAVHYFRIHPEQWEDRLRRVRHLGLNTVDVYVPWNVHQPSRDGFDFAGGSDVVAFLELVDRLGLKVLLRPGPYIAAEWDFGGFPAWLLAEQQITLRCSEPVYQGHVGAWFAQLLPRLRHLQHEHGGPVIAVQVENEYGTYGNDRAHLRWLADTIASHGFVSMQLCSSGVESDSMLRGGSLPDLLASVDFDGAPDEPFARLERFRPGTALLCSEHWIGWFDAWGDARHHTVDADEVARNLDAILARGASVNLYMAAGGTSFGWTGGATVDPATGRYQPMTTSYDYDAPVAEDGTLTPKFHAIRDVIGRYGDVPPGPPPRPPAFLPARRLTAEGATSLLGSLDRLGTWQRHLTPPTMERLGLAQGLLLYRTELDGPSGEQPLTIPGLGDRASVFLDGALVGRLDRNDPAGSSVPVTVPGHRARLDVLVDTLGRVSYGPRLWDPKGIRGPVLLGPQALFHFDVCPLPLTDLSAIRFGDDDHEPAPGEPIFYRHSLEVRDPRDAHLAFSGYTHLQVWLGRHLLGRWWDRGPQLSLYAPAPLWEQGRNTVTVLSYDGRPGEVSTVRAPRWSSGGTRRHERHEEVVQS
jgi:beta-galactosidase